MTRPSPAGFRCQMARPLVLRLKYLLQRSVLGALARLFPRAEWAQFHLGNAHAEHGHPERALLPWTRACARTPPRPAAALNLAAARLEKGEPEEAIEPLERLVAHRPDHVQAWTLLGKAQQRAKAIAAAIVAFEKVVQLEPANDAVRLTLAVLLEKSSRRAEALDCYRAITDPALRPKAEQRIHALAAVPPARAGG